MAQQETKSAFARRIGKSPARVSQLVGAGLPVTQSGQVPVDEALAWIATNAAHPGGDENLVADALMAARIRSTNALADLREFDLSVKRGRYASRAAIEASMASLSGLYAHQLALALRVPVAEAAAALDGIAARITHEARLDRGVPDDALLLENNSDV